MIDLYEKGYEEGIRQTDAKYVRLLVAVQDYVDLYPDSDVASLIRALNKLREERHDKVGRSGG
jgi:hypothetical protein